MEKDDEFNEVCVRLLPERFLAPAEKVVQERRNVVGQRVGVEVIVERVVPVIGVKADFNVVGGAPVFFKHGSDLMTEVAFDFQDETTNPAHGVFGLVGQELLRERVHTAARLAATDGSENGNSGIEPALGDG